MTSTDHIIPPHASGNGSSGRLRLVFADRPDLVRVGIEGILDGQSDLELVGIADSLPDAVRVTRAHHPDVLIADLIRLADGADVATSLQPLVQAAPSVAIVILSDSRDPFVARESLTNGARGYALKSAHPHELFDAVRRVANGGSYLAPELGGAVADITVGRNGELLSAREAEVLRLIALGYTNAEIAAALFLSVRTIETHRARLHAKLGTTTRAELVGIARERGLLG